ncbi:MAG: hypothetical protein IT173_03620, partial [Acidobacteria bacterium]|nr:hypothetical protein [Acidobacteriota bacterium]
LNPVVRAIVEGTAPRPAVVAASRGVLPLPPTDLLEVLVRLARSDDGELSTNARATLSEQDPSTLEGSLRTADIASAVLDHFAQQTGLPTSVYEAIITNEKTTADTFVRFARTSNNGEMLERLALNQQLLIQTPALIEAIIANPASPSEAERRASETKREFFEKERGAQQIANELRAQGKEAAAEFIEQSEFGQDLDAAGMNIDDALFLASMIEVPDSETDDSWLGLEYIEEIYEESAEQRQAVVDKILGEFRFEDGEVGSERLSVLNRVMQMGMKDRVKLAMKGDREARNILIRDPNRIVASAVVQNPRITEQEMEKISAMRSIPEDILRMIANDRQWARSYAIVHNLARNPRTPIANVMNILSRLQLRDLTGLSKNKNVSDAVRRQAARLSQARTGK